MTSQDCLYSHDKHYVLRAYFHMPSTVTGIEQGSKQNRCLLHEPRPGEGRQTGMEAMELPMVLCTAARTAEQAGRLFKVMGCFG